ncbi:MAG: pyrroline-5-carboxylate reductase [Planctomycetia bacterium]|jgi:pyrroline-5-carboxylate reductase|nr:pyrroline-5-carboxylate reductase [Planctomycetia bacterium]
MREQRVGFIGAGQMATALAQGLIERGVTSPEGLIASDPAAEARHRFAELTHGRVTADNRQVAAEAEVLFLSVKPQQLDAVLAELGGHIPAQSLVISIVAGVRLAVLTQGLGGTVRLVRVMPNTPCLVGLGASGYCLGEHATAEDGKLVERLLSAAGIAFEVEERLLDAVTGLSGSGPAFVYMMIEALSDGGVRMGLPRAVATTLAAQTVRGAAQMVLSTGDHPGVLKDRVTSPGGTTIAGIQALESAGFRAAVMAAVEAAARRSAELGNG